MISIDVDNFCPPISGADLMLPHALSYYTPSFPLSFLVIDHISYLIVVEQLLVF